MHREKGFGEGEVKGEMAGVWVLKRMKGKGGVYYDGRGGVRKRWNGRLLSRTDQGLLGPLRAEPSGMRAKAGVA